MKTPTEFVRFCAEMMNVDERVLRSSAKERRISRRRQAGMVAAIEIFGMNQKDAANLFDKVSHLTARNAVRNVASQPKMRRTVDLLKMGWDERSCPDIPTRTTIDHA